MKVLINFADKKFRFSQKTNSFTGKYIGGFDKVIEYSPADIDDEFYQKNKQTLDTKRGAGLWLWKPYFILKTLETLQEGDVLFYCDSGSIFIRNTKVLINEMEMQNTDIFIPFVPLQLKQWMRKEVFEKLDINNSIYHNSFQPLAGFIQLKKSDKSLKFIREWLDLCQDYHLIRDAYIDEINYPEFIEHRHDQSLLNVLTVKHNLINYRDISQLGVKPFNEVFYKYNSNKDHYNNFKGVYPTILLLYRSRNIISFLFSHIAKTIIYKLNKRLYYLIVNNKT